MLAVGRGNGNQERRWGVMNPSVLKRSHFGMFKRTVKRRFGLFCKRVTWLFLRGYLHFCLGHNGMKLDHVGQSKMPKNIYGPNCWKFYFLFDVPSVSEETGGGE